MSGFVLAPKFSELRLPTGSRPFDKTGTPLIAVSIHGIAIRRPNR